MCLRRDIPGLLYSETVKWSWETIFWAVKSRTLREQRRPKFPVLS